MEIQFLHPRHRDVVREKKENSLIWKKKRVALTWVSACVRDEARRNEKNVDERFHPVVHRERRQFENQLPGTACYLVDASIDTKTVHPNDGCHVRLAKGSRLLARPARRKHRRFAPRHSSAPRLYADPPIAVAPMSADRRSRDASHVFASGARRAILSHVAALPGIGYIYNSAPLSKQVQRALTIASLSLITANRRVITHALIIMWVSNLQVHNTRRE